ncbi:hypothetical protein NPIL_195481 [Nephila pilipes]|uniref:Uncharacterized protein n=1 Tax=Nephila pilipes TaxID=299642 RepID=A0A8X6NJ39_NEPPI|nr:hypothetical protein NPIL_195481 [Nephila pilipes]
MISNLLKVILRSILRIYEAPVRLDRFVPLSKLRGCEKVPSSAEECSDGTSASQLAGCLSFSGVGYQASLQRCYDNIFCKIGLWNCVETALRILFLFTSHLFINMDLFHSSCVFLSLDRVRRPMKSPYANPYKVLKRTSKVFTLEKDDK